MMRELHHVLRRQGVDGEADPVDGDRAVRHEEGGELRRHGDVDEAGVARLLDTLHLPDSVDVALDEVPAQPVAEPERPLQVDPRPRASRRWWSARGWSGRRRR